MSDSIFICHPGMSDERTPDEYWKGRIKQIRQDDAGRIWVAVAWYYSAEDLLPFLSGKKYVLYTCIS